MRKYVACSSSSSDIYSISRQMKRLRDVIDNAPSDVLDVYGLNALYNELLDSIQELDYQIYPDTEY